MATGKKRESVKDYLARIGSKGGKAKGKSKVRGDSEYYRRIRKKRKADGDSA